MRLRVLVVDDEPDVRLTLRTMLEDRDWVVDEVADGESALAYCERRQPDAVLLDHKMPGVSGMEVARTMRGNGVRSPIILYSAYLTPSLIREAESLGLWAVAKPDVDELIDVLEDTIAGNGERKAPEG